MQNEPVIALCGNPNVGKSTLFNALTGMKQHTGNWSGKTVSLARGICTRGGKRYGIVDLPGTYSLLAHSKEEEIASGFIADGNADAAVVVCDATCLVRSLTLAMQVSRLNARTVICINLMDEAERRGINIDTAKLEALSGLPCAGKPPSKSCPRRKRSFCARRGRPPDAPLRSTARAVPVKSRPKL